jgi:hypothetical protein
MNRWPPFFPARTKQNRGDENALTYAGTPALHKNPQHDHQQHAGNDPAEQNVIHIESPFPRDGPNPDRFRYQDSPPAFISIASHRRTNGRQCDERISPPGFLY